MMVSVHVDAQVTSQVGFISYFNTISRHGEVVLHNKETKRILVYKYEPASGTFTEMWQLDCPQELNEYSRIRFMYDSEDATIVSQPYYNGRTLLINAESGDQLQAWEQAGGLIGCLSQKRRVYALKNESTTSWEVCIVDENNRKSYLRPPQGHAWSSEDISICENEVTGNKAICHAPVIPQDSEHSLDIFNCQGKSIRLNMHGMCYEVMVSKFKAGRERASEREREILHLFNKLYMFTTSEQLACLRLSNLAESIELYLSQFWRQLSLLLSQSWCQFLITKVITCYTLHIRQSSSLLNICK